MIHELCHLGKSLVLTLSIAHQDVVDITISNTILCDQVRSQDFEEGGGKMVLFKINGRRFENRSKNGANLKHFWPHWGNIPPFPPVYAPVCNYPSLSHQSTVGTMVGRYDISLIYII